MFLETLSLSDAPADIDGNTLIRKRVTLKLLPVVEHALREGTAGGGSAESLSETERLGDGQEGLKKNEGSTLDLLLRVDDTSALGEALVDTTDGIVRALDLDQEDGFLEARLGGQLGSEEHASHGWGNLATTSVDSVSVEGDILNVEADTSHVLVRESTFLGGPLEGGVTRVLDFVQELALFGDVDKQVGTSAIRAEAPDLLGIVGVPIELIDENLVALLNILAGTNLIILNSIGELVGEGHGAGEDSVVLVGRL